MNLSTQQLTNIGLGLAVCFGVYKFVGHPAAKAAALGVAGVIVAKQIPFVQDALAV